MLLILLYYTVQRMSRCKPGWWTPLTIQRQEHFHFSRCFSESIVLEFFILVTGISELIFISITGAYINFKFFSSFLLYFPTLVLYSTFILFWFYYLEYFIYFRICLGAIFLKRVWKQSILLILWLASVEGFLYFLPSISSSLCLSLSLSSSFGRRSPTYESLFPW